MKTYVVKTHYERKVQEIEGSQPGMWDGQTRLGVRMRTRNQLPIFRKNISISMAKLSRSEELLLLMRGRHEEALKT